MFTKKRSDERRATRSLLSILVVLAGLAAGCSAGATGSGGPSGPTARPTPSEGSPAMNRPIDQIAESYVKLVLAVGQHDPDYVDAYYGPPEWRTEAQKQKRPLADLRAEASSLIADLQAKPPGDGGPASGPDTELVRLRHEYLTTQLRSMVARIDMLSGRKLSFDEESKALYDAVAPTHDAKHFQGILDELDAALPGDGPVVEQLDRFRQAYVIPREKLDAVFSAAIEECRRRTREHVELPAGESFRVEYVTGKSWSGYNWYQGNYRSLIQVNTDLPIFIDRALDLACHEGYPGHHAYNMLLEKHLVRDRGWSEFTVYPLFSPQSLIAEGTANFGIEVAFPGDERVEYEKSKLFPLAGLDPAGAGRYYEVQKLVQRLGYAGNEAARRYLNGESGKDEAVDWLMRYGLYTRERAEQRIRFMDTYRSYVINYNLGQDLVKEYIEKKGGTADHPEKRWEEFEELISSPRLPSGLR